MMNTLSWLIYAASVLDNLSVGIAVGCFMSMGVVALVWFGRMFSGGMVYDLDMPSEMRPEGSRDYQKWLGWKTVTSRRSLYVVPVALFLLAAILPSSRTIWLIAASEAGEAVVTSPDAIEMMGDLKAIIKKRLKEELGE